MQDTDSVLGQGAEISHALRPKHQNMKQKQCCNKFNIDFKNLKKKSEGAIYFPLTPHCFTWDLLASPGPPYRADLIYSLLLQLIVLALSLSLSLMILLEKKEKKSSQMLFWECILSFSHLCSWNYLQWFLHCCLLKSAGNPASTPELSQHSETPIHLRHLPHALF